MKFSISICLLFFASIAFAQLSVQNDAYIFVNDEVLFVTDDVNIDDANSKIYLREEAQLVQGSGTTGNSGVGELSVYQTGNVNQWSYNYWCSPVGNNSAALGNEDARVDLIDDATGLISSVDAQFIAGYDGVSSPLQIPRRWLWTFQTSNQYADWIYVGETGAISPGLGFTMKGMGTGLTGNQLYDFRGKPNNGTISNDVVTGLNTLIGNPYPSAIDSAAFIHDPANQASITGTLLFWEQDGSVPSHFLEAYRGGYYLFSVDALGAIVTSVPAPFNTYDGSGNQLFLGPVGNGSKVSGRYIPIGQGFMVEGDAGTLASPATVVMKNEYRVFHKESDGNSFFFRGTSDSSEANNTNEIEGIEYQSNGLSIVPEDYKRFRINVDFTVDEAQYTRQLVLNFHDSATDGFDYGLELIRSESSDSDAYFLFDEKIFSGQAFPFDETLTIPVVIDIEQDQPLRFRIFDIQNFDESQGIYLHDTETDVYTNLRNLDYELNIAAGNYTNRFEIVFSNQSLSIDDAFDLTSLKIQQNNNDHQLTIYNPNGLDIKTIEVYDVAGKRLIEANFDNAESQYDLSTLRLSDGVYVVNVSSEDNTNFKSQKVIVKN